jgi:probable nitrogen fixation protein
VTASPAAKRDAAAAEEAAAAPPVPDTPFLRALVRLMRAHDTFGVWEKRPDSALLAPFVVTREQRRKIPILDDPDPKLRWRLEVFYSAVAMALQQTTEVEAMPLMRISREGFGPAVILAGRLVAVSRTLRDVHRFGFETLAALAAEGDALVAEGAAMIAKFPEAAKA